MSDGRLEQLEHARQDADRQYNEALTAFDSALVRASSIPDASVVAETTAPAPSTGWRAWWLRGVQRWLAPWIERQHAFNTGTAATVEALLARERDRSAAFEQFQSALIVFLQQITAFVESKDRQIAGGANHEFEGHQRQLENIKQQILTLEQQLDANLSDLHAQAAVLQRTVQMLKRERAEVPAAGPPGQTVSPAADDYKYVAFEDQFRGSTEEIRGKFSEYVSLFSGVSDVLDVGCGRGEFLALLREAGVSARGVDLNGEMIGAAREEGLDAVCGDALAFVESLPNGSLGGLFTAQVVEHLRPPYLMRLLETAFDKMRSGAPIVIETINPECWLAFFSSYLRDFTHVQPIHPDALAYLVRASGFTRVSVQYSAPVAAHTRMHEIEVAPEIAASTDSLTRALVAAARVVNHNADVLNKKAFGFQDYAVIGYRS